MSLESTTHRRGFLAGLVGAAAAAGLSMTAREASAEESGGAPLQDFAAVRHRLPMQSLNNCFSEEELGEFDRRIHRTHHHRRERRRIHRQRLAR